ncbi:MAG: hypothetical protein KDB08_05535 [Microthrixaceae bacterium]|nr:hypothetical protein [Microthrixaceae bacterium]
MTRPTDWSSLGYGSDPVPGDHSRVDLIGRMYVGTADSIKRAVDNFETALDPEFGHSKTMDAIREVSGDVADRVHRAEDRYRRVGEAVIVYAAALRIAQQNSADALASANAAETALHSANNMAAYYQRQVDSPDTPPANLAGYTQSQSTWEGRANEATRTISSAVATLQSAISSRDSAANTAISSIENVGDSGNLNDSAWDNIVQWVHENKELIDLIVDIVGYIATAVMVIALFIPGLNAIVGLVALIATIVTLANVALQVAAGTMGPVEALLNVGLAALTFVGGRAISTAVKGTQSAVGASVSNSIRGSYGSARISGMTQARAMSMVDEAIAVSRPGQLTMLERLKYLTLDFRQVSEIRNVANIQLLSGNLSSHSARHMARLAQLSGFSFALEGGSQIAELAINSGTANEKPLAWRLGDNW